MNNKMLPLCFLLGGALVLGVATLCSCTSDQGAWTTQDSWYNATPPETPRRSEWEKLDRARIHEALESRELQAEEHLQDVSIVELTAEQAAEFIGAALPDVPGTQPYLTRGVYLNRGTGAFSAYTLENQLLVHHSSLGHSAVPMKRQALVLQLELKPRDVFLTCSMAE
ncbi:hypothetical protein ACFLT5_04115 [Chloroflexota bacterium]